MPDSLNSNNAALGDILKIVQKLEMIMGVPLPVSSRVHGYFLLMPDGDQSPIWKALKWLVIAYNTEVKHYSAAELDTERELKAEIFLCQLLTDGMQAIFFNDLVMDLGVKNLELIPVVQFLTGCYNAKQHPDAPTWLRLITPINGELSDELLMFAWVMHLYERMWAVSVGMACAVQGEPLVGQLDKDFLLHAFNKLLYLYQARRLEFKLPIEEGAEYAYNLFLGLGWITAEKQVEFYIEYAKQIGNE